MLQCEELESCGRVAASAVVTTGVLIASGWVDLVVEVLLGAASGRNLVYTFMALLVHTAVTFQVS